MTARRDPVNGRVSISRANLSNVRTDSLLASSMLRDYAGLVSATDPGEAERARTVAKWLRRDHELAIATLDNPDLPEVTR